MQWNPPNQTPFSPSTTSHYSLSLWLVLGLYWRMHVCTLLFVNPSAWRSLSTVLSLNKDLIDRLIAFMSDRVYGDAVHADWRRYAYNWNKWRRRTHSDFQLFPEHYSCKGSDTDAASLFHKVKYDSRCCCSTSRHYRQIIMSVNQALTSALVNKLVTWCA